MGFSLIMKGNEYFNIHRKFEVHSTNIFGFWAKLNIYCQVATAPSTTNFDSLPQGRVVIYLFFFLLKWTCIVSNSTGRLVFVKDTVLYCLRTRQRAQSTSRAPKTRGMSAFSASKVCQTVIQWLTVASHGIGLIQIYGL